MYHPLLPTSSTINHQPHLHSKEALHSLYWYNHITTVHNLIAKLLLYIYRGYIQYFQYNINCMFSMFHETKLISITVCYLQAKIMSRQTDFEEFPSYRKQNHSPQSKQPSCSHCGVDDWRLKKMLHEAFLTLVHHLQIHFHTLAKLPWPNVTTVVIFIFTYFVKFLSFGL